MTPRWNGKDVRRRTDAGWAGKGLAVLWLCWSVLWTLLFASMALGVARVDLFPGWALVLASQVTATAPALLGLAGLWPRSPLHASAAAVLLAGLFVAAGILARRSLAARGAARSSTAAPDRAVPGALADAGEEVGARRHAPEC